MMVESLERWESAASDDHQLQRLPMPLGPLYRRACHAKTPLDRHLTAFYFWEASLKLLGAVAIVKYAAQDERDPKVDEALKSLARPSTGHWWQYVQLLVPVLAKTQQASYGQIKETLFGRTRRDLTHAVALDAALRDALADEGGARHTVRLNALFEQLVRYRNREIGHGAAGRRGDAFYDHMGQAILAGVSEILSHLDVLAGNQLIYVSDVRRQRSGDWLIKRLELSGGEAHPVESLEWPEAAGAELPQSDRIYLAAPGTSGTIALPGTLQLLHPLAVFDAQQGNVAFLNARRGKSGAEYLCYTSGRVYRQELRNDQCEFLARILGISVDENDLVRWTEASSGDEKSDQTHGGEDPRRTLGEFILTRKLGRGGAGIVWRAWQPSLGREVAVKSLLRTDDAQAEARFGREIRALARVEHPHLIKVFTSGVEDDQWFYAMELIEGADMNKIANELAGADASTVVDNRWQEAVRTATEEAPTAEPVKVDSSNAETKTDGRALTKVDSPPHRTGATPLIPRGHISQVVEIIRQVATATHALHEAGVVHRDIKPGNIMMIRGTNHAVLTDLGIAQIADECEGRLTRTRQFVGTLRYASPEQLISAADVDRRTDVYSLGATLWELLTLKPLHDATENTTTPELMRRIQVEDPVRPRKYNERIERDLEAIVLKCLERDRDRRYQTARELAEDLARWQHNEPVRAQPPTLAYVFSKHVRRNKLQIATIAGLILVALVGTIIAFYAVNEQRKLAYQARNTARESEEKAVEAHKEAEELADIERKLRIEAEYQSAITSVDRSYLACVEQGPVAGVFSLAGSLKALLAAQNNLHETLGVERGDVSQFDARIEGLESATRLQLAGWSRDLHRLRSMIDVHSPVLAVSFSPAGRTVASGSVDGYVRLWDASTGKQVGSDMNCQSAVTGVTFHPSQSQLIAATDAGRLYIWDTNGDSLREPFGEVDRINCLCISPDGRHVLVGYGSQHALVYEINSGRSVGERWMSDAPVTAVGFSSSGDLAFIGDDRGGVQVRTTSSWLPASQNLTGDGPVWAIAAAPGGKSVFVAFADGDVRLENLDSIDAAHHGGARASRFATPRDSYPSRRSRPNPLVWPALSSRRVLFGLVQAPGPPAQPRPPAPPRAIRVSSMAISRNQTTYAVAQDDGRIHIRSLNGGFQLGAPLVHRSPVAALDYAHGDSMSLVTGCLDGKVWIWDLQAPQQRDLKLDFQNPVFTVAASPDCQIVAAGGKVDMIRLWQKSTGEATTLTVAGAQQVYDIAFSPDSSQLLAGCHDGKARLLNVADGTLLRQFEHDKTVSSVAFSPDGQTIATGCDDFQVRLWDLATGTTKRTLTHGDEIYALAFSGDGTQLLTGGKDSRVQLWDVATGDSVNQFRHPGIVYAVGFVPSGEVIVSGGKGGAQLWNAETGNPIGQRMHETDEVRGIAINSDGAYIVTVSNEGNVRFWDIRSTRAIGIPWRKPAPLGSVALTRDGTLITGDIVGSVELATALTPMAGDPERILTWAELIAGQELQADGLQPLEPDSWDQKKRKLNQLGGPPSR